MIEIEISAHLADVLTASSMSVDIERLEDRKEVAVYTSQCVDVMLPNYSGGGTSNSSELTRHICNTEIHITPNWKADVANRFEALSKKIDVVDGSVTNLDFTNYIFGINETGSSNAATLDSIPYKSGFYNLGSAAWVGNGYENGVIVSTSTVAPSYQIAFGGNMASHKYLANYRSGGAWASPVELFHSSNLNRSDIDFNAKNITANGDVVGNNITATGTVKGKSIESTDGAYGVKIGNVNGSASNSFTHYITNSNSHYFNKSLYIAGEIYAGASYNKLVYHAGNSNLSTVDWTTKQLIANSTIVSYLSGDAVSLLGSGTGTYTRGNIHNSQANGLILQAPLQTDVVTGVKNPLVFTWRGGYAAQGGMKLTDGLAEFSGTTSANTNRVQYLQLTNTVAADLTALRGKLYYGDNGYGSYGIVVDTSQIAAGWRSLYFNGENIKVNNNIVYHAGNSNLPTVDWTMNNATVANNALVGGTLGVKKDIYHPNFISGFTGTKGQIDANWNAEFQSISVRGLARFYELEINKIRATNGALAVTDAAVIKTVNGNILGFDDLPVFQVGDILRAQRWANGIRGFSATVSAVDNTAKTVTIGTFITGDASQVVAGDTVIRWDSNIEDRRGLIYMTSSDSYSPYVDVVHAGITKLRLGKLDGINDLRFADLTPATRKVNNYSLYADGVYLSGTFNVTGGNAETISGATTKANSAKTDAISAAAADAKSKVDFLSSTLGSLAYKSAVSAALLDSTVISGGYIKSSLLDVNTIIVNGAIAKTTDVSVAVNNISIGGRNLILNSKSYTLAATTNNYNNYAATPNLLNSTTYTFSCTGSCAAGTFASYDIKLYDGTSTISIGPFNVGVRGKVMFTTQSSGTWRVLVYAGMAGATANNSIIITERKLETGNKATDWTPAPEDVDTNIETAKTAAITAAATDAASKISTFNGTLGALAKKSLIDLSLLDSTIISGGYIKSTLLDVNTIIVNGGIAKTADVNTAKTAAISAAATDATTKANTAQSAAITAAATDATTKANTAKSDAIATAGTNADSKISTFNGTLGALAKKSLIDLSLLDSTIISGGYIKSTLLDVNTIIVNGGIAKTADVNTAKTAAISAAATDATTKANTAQSAAITAAATDATTKANTAKSDAIATAGTNADTKITTFGGTLGALAKKSLIDLSLLDSTIISGGYIKSTLLDVNTIIVNGGIAKTADVSTAVNNISIGGRNLASRSAIIPYSSTVVTNGFTYTVSNVGTNGGGLKLNANLFNPDMQYVFQFKIKKLSGTLSSIGGHSTLFAQQTVYIDNICVGSNFASGLAAMSIDDGNYHKVVVIGTTIANLTGDTNLYIQPNRNTSYGTSCNVEIKDIQLECGNKATDWTPAPEDVDSNIATAQSAAITAAATDATTKANTAKSDAIATAGTNADSKISTFNGTLGTLAKKSLIDLSLLDSTIISGGYIKSTLLDVNTIIVNGGFAKTADVNTAITAAIWQADANASLTLNDFAESLGSLAYDGMVGLAKLDSTIISGGYIKSTLLDVNTIIVNGGIAKTTDVNTAKTAAISAAATDATNKANTAQSNAISTAATDATNKANAVKDCIIPNLGNALKLNYDEYFTTSWNGINIYDNSGTGNITISRTAKESDTPTSSGYMLLLSIKGSVQSPGLGGFYFATPTEANNVYITRFVAKVPVGYSMEFASNSIGTGGMSQWVSNNIGTGKYEEYVYKVKAGYSGSFSSTNFFYFTGGSPSAAAPLNVQIASATVYNTTKDDIIEKSKLGTTLIQGGYIKSELIDVSTIIVNGGIAKTTDVNAAITAGVSQADANACLTLTDFAESLGSLAHENAVSSAMLDSTLISGGYLRTSLIDCASIKALGNVTAGSFNIGSGKFVVDTIGNLTATNANITGTINAGAGIIGGFSIYATYMTAQDNNYGAFTINSKQGIYYHGYGNQLGKQFEIAGTPSVIGPSIRDDSPVGYFKSTSTTSGLSHRVAIHAIAENGTYNTAIQAKGTVVGNSIVDYGVQYAQPSGAGSSYELDLRKNHKFVISTPSTGACEVVPPSISYIEQILGISSSEDFAIDITIIGKYNNNGWIYFRPKSNFLPDGGWGSTMKGYSGQVLAEYPIGKGNSVMATLFRVNGEKWIQVTNVVA